MKALLLLLLLLAHPAFGETREQKIERIISHVEMNPLRLGMVTPDIRDELIVELRSRIREGALAFYNPYCSALVKLGDEQTIEKLMQMMEQKSERKAWLRTEITEAQPLLIPYLAKDFFRDDGEDVTSEVFEGDIVYISAPGAICSAFLVLGIIQGAPEFSPEVKEWAVQVSKKALVRKPMDERRDSPNIFREDSVRQFREMMRQWWRANEGHFKAKNYGAVKPFEARLPTNPWMLPAAIGLLLLSAGASVIVFRWKKGALPIGKSADPNGLDLY